MPLVLGNGTISGPSLIAGTSANGLSQSTTAVMSYPQMPWASGSLRNNSGASGDASDFATASLAYSGTTNLTWDSTNKRFTVPVSGVYLITMNHLGNNSTSGRYDIAIAVNGSYWTYTLSEADGSGFHHRSAAVTVQLAANDYVGLMGTAWYTGGGVEWNRFSICLIG